LLLERLLLELLLLELLLLELLLLLCTHGGLTGRLYCSLFRLCLFRLCLFRLCLFRLSLFRLHCRALPLNPKWQRLLYSIKNPKP
jgi:hypothetical protein